MTTTTPRLFIVLALASSLSACGSKDKAAEQTAVQTTTTTAPATATAPAETPAPVAETPAAAAAPAATFDLSQVPVSSASLGKFPYLNKLPGYKFNVPSDSVGYAFERSYVYDGKNLVAVEGKVVRRSYLAADEKTKASDLLVLMRQS